MNSMQQYLPNLQQKHMQMPAMQQSNEMLQWQSSGMHQSPSNIVNWSGGGPNYSSMMTHHPQLAQGSNGPLNDPMVFESVNKMNQMYGQQVEYARGVTAVNHTGGMYYSGGARSSTSGRSRPMLMESKHCLDRSTYNQQAYSLQDPSMGQLRLNHNSASMSELSQLSPLPIDPTAPLGSANLPCEGDLKIGRQGHYGPQQRMAPYPNPQQYMQTKRAQYNVRGQPIGHQQIVYNGSQVQVRASLSPQGQQWSPNSWTRQNSGGESVSPSYPSIDSGNVRLSTQPYSNSSHFGIGNSQVNNVQISPTRATGLQNPIGKSSSRNYELPSFPGNPTPPTTPGAAGHPFYPSPDSNLAIPNNSHLTRSCRDLEPKFSIPMREGLIMEPFRLEHNLTVTNHLFVLREQDYQLIVGRPDIDLQLKCYHNEDRLMSTNWPASLSVAINSTPLPIDRGDPGNAHHQPLYLKNHINAGKNVLQITVTACCCSHLFVVQLVHRPAIRSVLENLLTKKLLAAEHGIAKVKRVLVGHETMTVKFSLICPISLRKIVLPARGHDCQHIQCFDLENYLRLNCEQNVYLCPICRKLAMIEGLEIDQYMWGIVRHMQGTRFEEVIIDAMANWKPTIYNEADMEGSVQWKKGISLDKMRMPTLSTWHMMQQGMQQSMQLSMQQNMLNVQGMHTNMQQALHTNFQPSMQQNMLQQNMVQNVPHTLSRNSDAGNNIYNSTESISKYTNTSSNTTQSAPDYLNCLSQLSNSIMSSLEDLPPTSRPIEPTSFPPTPMGSNISSITTPLDGQSLHPRTPSDGANSHSHTSPEGSISSSVGHPRTPFEARTPLESTYCNNTFINPATPGTQISSDGGSAKRSSGLTISKSEKEISNVDDESEFDFKLGIEIGGRNNNLLSEGLDDDLSRYLGPSDKETSSESPTVLNNGDDLLSLIS